MMQSLIFVALVIALVWLILYCFYMKQLISDCYTRISKVQDDRRDLESRVYKLSRELGYEFDSKWSKKEGIKQ